MRIDLKPIDYRNMTWKEVFETIQFNIRELYDFIIANQSSVDIEQFDGEVQSITVSTPVEDKTEWFIFRDDMFLGRREDSGRGYTVNGQVITFDTELEVDESATVMIVSGDTLSVLAGSYVEEIQQIYNDVVQMDQTIDGQIQEVISMKSMLDQSSEDIFSAKRDCAAYKDYIDQLLGGTTPSQGEFADEIVAARRGAPLIGSRLDKMVTTAIEKQSFLDSADYRDGDWVFVKDGNAVYLFMVYDQYTGTLPTIHMTQGQTAVILMSLEDYADIPALKREVNALKEENALLKTRLDDLEERIHNLENN